MLGGIYGWQNHHKSSVQTPAKLAAAKQAPAPEGLSSRLMFVGDVFWGRSVQRKAEKSGQSYEYLTHGLTVTDRTQYDAWIANFECPITNRDVPYEQQVGILRFNCRPEYLPNLAKWFTAASLANNHMDNNGGKQGQAETRQSLEQNDIQHFGSYDMSETNDLCEVVSLPAQTTLTHKAVKLPVVLCGYMYVVDATPTEAQLAVMQRYAKVMPVIAMPHMGIEYRATAENEKVSAYHRMIDNGADAVIGAHPHVIQNSESYKGHLIAYSLGNFLFDQQTVSRATTLGLAVGMKLGIADGKVADSYSKLADSCVAYKDDCLSQLEASIKKRPAITVSYNFTCYDEASGVPVLGSDAACAEAKKAGTVDQLSNLSTQW